MNQIRIIRAAWASIAVVFLFGICTGCAPSLAPKYGDFRIERPDAPEALYVAEEDSVVLGQISEALEESGWKLRAADVENAVATDKRKFATWGMYSVEAELEVVVIGRQYVRVFIHPYRRYFWGGRGNIPYLKSGLARAVIESFNDSFEARGFVFIGNAAMRDAETRNR